MTLDEAIKHAEEVAEEQEKAAKEWHENQVRKCELIRFAEMDYTHENECKKCADEHRQLAEWLKDYKRLLEQQTSDCKIFGTKENCFSGATENECNHCDYNVQTLKQQPYEDEVQKVVDYLLTPKSKSTSDDCVSRKQAKIDVIPNSLYTSEQVIALLDNLPPVTPTHGMCKDCTKSKILNGFEGYSIVCSRFGRMAVNPDFYCADFEKGGNENGSN